MIFNVPAEMSFIMRAPLGFSSLECDYTAAWVNCAALPAKLPLYGVDVLVEVAFLSLLLKCLIII